jgi:hypothetical protein
MSTKPVVPDPPPTRSLWRVNYYVNNTIVSAYVVSFTAADAINFLGVRDNSATATAIANPVEVLGVDKAHAAIPVLPVTMTYPPPPPQLTTDELAQLRKMLAGK